MIPAPVPVFPIIAVLVVVAAVFLYAAWAAGRGAARLESGAKPRTIAIGVASVAAFLALGTSAFMVNILASHDRLYSQTVASVLDASYGVRPATAGQEIRPGIPFPAVLDGADTECSITPPSLVVCGGEAVAAR